MGVHYVIMQWQNSVLLLGESTVLKLQVKKLRMHVELKISVMELTTLGILEIVCSFPGGITWNVSL